MLRSLPPELYRPISEAVHDLPTLLSLLLASRNLQSEAERVLYYRIDLSFTSLPKKLLLFQRLIDCQRVAHLVVKFRLFFPRRRELPTDDGDPIWALIRNAFRAMINMKYLYFGAIEGPLAERILLGCTFQLRILSWVSLFDETNMSRFLSGQIALEQLRLDLGRNAPVPSPATLPNLSVLCGGYETIRAFLPGRRVEVLYWRPIMDDRPDIPLISSSLQYLRILILGGNNERPHLCSLVDHLHNLEDLTVIMFKQESIMAEISLISRLPRLKVLTLSGVISFSADVLHACVQTAYSACESLCYVNIDYPPNNRINRYERWTRDSLVPILSKEPRSIGDAFFIF